jgi:hypothetical protein
VFEFVTDFVLWMTDLAAGAPVWQQFVVLLLGGAVPFVESYLGSFFGVFAGVNPVVAVVAAVAGNLAATFALIALSGRARDAATRGREGSKRQAKVAHYLERFGVAGVSLFGPFVVASQITGPTLVALGADKRSVLLWQGIAIVAWGVTFGFFGDVAITWLR